MEKQRTSHVPGLLWWKRELQMVMSVPVIFLAGLLTSIVVFEVFIMQLYTGPDKYIVSIPPHVFVHKLIPAWLHSLSA